MARGYSIGFRMLIKATDDEIKEIYQVYKTNTVLDPELGQLAYKGIPIMWSRVALLYHLQVEMLGLVGQAAFELMKNISTSHGVDFFKMANEYMGSIGRVVDKESLLRFMCAEAAAIGWGRVEIETQEDRYILTAPNGMPVGREAKAEGRTFEYGVDSYYLGYFTGYLSALDKKHYSGEERECLAKGDELCRFVVE